MKRHIVWEILFLCLMGRSASAGPAGRFSLVGLQTQAPSSMACPLGLACIGASSITGKPYLIDVGGLGWPIEESQAAWRLATAPSSPANGAWYYDTILLKFQFYNSGWFEPASKTALDAVERNFSRTCSLTSAAAATPVTCLADGDVPAGKSAYLLGWHAKVNGATAWATTATVSIKDTSGLAVPFVVMAVAALTGNAFVHDGSGSVTKSDAYALNLGSTATRGLVVVGDANGTGSTLVLTVFGVVK